MRNWMEGRTTVALLWGACACLGAHASVTLPADGTWRTTLEARDLDHDGTPDAYYDTALNITWQANPNLSASETFGVPLDNTYGTMNWVQSQRWIQGMNAANYLGFNDWRLPKMSDASAICDYQGGGGNCGDSYFLSADSSEFTHLMFVTLGTSGLSSDTKPFVSSTGAGYGMLAPYYWMQTTYAGDNSQAWAFEFRFGGGQYQEPKNLYSNYVWAVRDGDVLSVPEVSTGAQMALGLGLLVLLRKTSTLGHMRAPRFTCFLS